MEKEAGNTQETQCEAVNSNDLLAAVFDASINLMLYIKTNDYPEPMSEGCLEIARLNTCLEIALRSAGYIPKGKIGG